MKIERDRIEWLAGVRAGETLGSPGGDADPQPRLGELGRRHGARGRVPGEVRRRRVTRPRPGHADLVGRAQVRSRRCPRHPRARQRPRDHRAGGRRRARPAPARRIRCRDREPRRLARRHRRAGPADRSRCRSTRHPIAPRSGCSIRAVEAEIIRRIDQAKQAGDTLGGEVEVVARGLVVGLGSHVTLGPEARRTAGRAAHVDPRGEGRRDRARLRGGTPAGLRGARSDRRRRGRVRRYSRPMAATRAAASVAGATTPAASRAA